MKKYILPLLLMITSIVIFQSASYGQAPNNPGSQTFVEVEPPPQIEQAHEDWINSDDGKVTLATGNYIFTGVYWKLPQGDGGATYYAIYSHPSRDGLLSAVAIYNNGETAFFIAPSGFGYHYSQLEVVRNASKK